MRKSQTWLTIISILAGGFLFASFFTDQPLVRQISAETLLWAERFFAVLLFFAIADSSILQIRKAGDDSSMRLIRTIGFAAFLAVLILGLIKTPEDENFNRIIAFAQKMMESALAGIVCLSLIFAMYRLPLQQPSALKTSFVIGLIVFLLIYGGIPRMIDMSGIAANVVEWLECIPKGCLIGLLFGIALGGAVTGLRFILAGKIPSKEDK